MRTYAILAASMGLLACSSGSDKVNMRSKVSGAEGSRLDEVGIEAFVSNSEAGEGGLGLLGAAIIRDFEIGIRCTYGTANTVVERSFNKAAFDGNTAKLPRSAKNCASFLKSLSVAEPPAATKNWALMPPAGASSGSFSNGAVVTYTYTVPANPGASESSRPASAKVKRSVELPASIDVDASKNKLEFAFVLSTENASTQNSYTVQAQTVDADATVSGLTPPLYNIGIVSAAPNAGNCTLTFRATCTRPTATNNQLVACNDVQRVKTTVIVDSTTIAAAGITLDTQDASRMIKFNHVIPCDPGAAGTFSRQMVVKFVDDTDPAAAHKSTLTAPITLNLTFNPN